MLVSETNHNTLIVNGGMGFLHGLGTLNNNPQDAFAKIMQDGMCLFSEFTEDACVEASNKILDLANKGVIVSNDAFKQGGQGVPRYIYPGVTATMSNTDPAVKTTAKALATSQGLNTTSTPGTYTTTLQALGVNNGPTTTSQTVNANTVNTQATTNTTSTNQTASNPASSPANTSTTTPASTTSSVSDILGDFEDKLSDMFSSFTGNFDALKDIPTWELAAGGIGIATALYFMFGRSGGHRRRR